jgi:recombination protein RecA
VGNTVGSLSEVQQQIIIGTLLGDGSMRCKTNALLEINHTVRQKEYVDWKYRHLSELVRTPPKARNGNQGRIAYRFVTRSLSELTPFYRLFYEDGRKVIPEVALTPLTLAVWFMDDGCRSRSAVYLNTQQFDSDGQRLLLEMLRNQWSIDGSLNKDKTYYRIRISVAGSVKLVNLIEPYVIPQLRYKLPQVTP